MPNIANGDIVKAVDFPPTVTTIDDTQVLNLTNTSYSPGNPEVGVYFTAPTSGRVVITVGGGLRDNSGDNRVFMSPQVFEKNSSGSEILAPSVTNRGFGSIGESSEFMYASRSSLLEGLTPGQTYYPGSCM